jgi:transketolase
MTAGQHLELGSEAAAEITTGPLGQNRTVVAVRYGSDRPR